MLNNLKFLAILILAIGAIGGASQISAQAGGNKVLVTTNGKTLRQSDIDKVINFYEWAFNTEFTAAQREQFQELKTEEFRNDPAGSKKGNDDLTNFYSQLKTKSQSEQAELRRKFNASFVPDLRKEADDAQAQLLVSIFDGANDGANTVDESAANDEDASGDDSESVGDLSDFAGKWVWQNSGSGTWGGNGQYLGGSGTRTTYEFSSSGSVTYSGIMNTMMGGCSQQVFLKQTGRAALSGNQMTIKWSPGTSTRDYSCDRGGNYTKTAPASTETFPVSFKTNSTGQRLFCMNAGTSKETCFSPIK